MPEPQNERLALLCGMVASRESEKRYQHTLGVETEAAALGALLLPERVWDLRAAALLHDVTKCLDGEKQTELARSLGIDLTPELLASPQVLHGLTAARLIPRDFPDFASPEIVHAVEVHTTGAPDMSLFDKIIFVADYTEPGRKQAACRKTREQMWEELQKETDKRRVLDVTTCRILGDTLQYLHDNNRPAVSATEDAYRYLVRELHGRE